MDPIDNDDVVIKQVEKGIAKVEAIINSAGTNSTVKITRSDKIVIDQLNKGMAKIAVLQQRVRDSAKNLNMTPAQIEGWENHTGRKWPEVFKRSEELK